MTLENLQQALGENNKELMKRLAHANQDVLDKFSIDNDGNVLYNGEKIISDIQISAAAGNAIKQKADGIHVEDLSENVKDISKKVNSIKAYQRYTNTDHEYGYFGIYANGSGSITFAAMNPVTLDKKYGNIDYPIILHKDKKYRIAITISFEAFDCDECYGSIIPHVDNKIIGNINLIGNDKIGNGQYHTETQEYIVEINKDSEFKLISNLFNGKISLGRPQSGVIIEEIGHNVVIDPLEYVNDQQGIEDTPVGHILSYMGNIPPKHYLNCDGSEYDILKYPYLAEHIREQFGSYNFFGGDGTNTFAVPDLRGEFLRGTSEAARATGSGANVGEHQDATSIPCTYVWSNGTSRPLIQGHVISPESLNGMGNISQPINMDTSELTSSNLCAYNETQETSALVNAMTQDYTVRPTNTSVMYCIKYEPTYYFHHTTNTTVHETKNVTENITKEISSLDYLQTHSDLEGVPVGHILTYMGNVTPKHYLSCDGTVYNISQYKLLAEHIKKEFGSYNYFGGNGSTTFAVPDLRGEFLRGEGTATRNTGSGSSVGVHQNPTNHINVNAYGSPQSYLLQTRQSDTGAFLSNVDSVKNERNWINYSALNKDTDNGGASTFTSRPTNTSVKYCIKYEPTYALSTETEISDEELQQAILETIDELNKKEV